MSRNQVSVVANHEIKFVTPTGVDASTDTITLAFASGFTMGPVSFDDMDFAVDSSAPTSDCGGAFTDKTVAAAAGLSPIWGASVAGTTITLTPPTNAAAGEVTAGVCVRLRVGTNASVGTVGDHQITNPALTSANTLNVAGGFGDTGLAYLYLNDSDQVTITATVDASGGGPPPPPPPPSPPVITNVRVLNVTETEADVLWDTDIASTSTVNYGTTISYGSDATTGGTVFNHSVHLNGLTPGTLYHYRVRSTGAGLESVSGDFAFTTLDTTPPVLSNIQAVDVTGVSARITWDTDEDADSRVDYGIAPGPPYPNFVFSGGLTNAHSLTVSGLTPSTLYRFRVTSKDAALNSVTSVEFTFLTLDTIAPVISAIAVTNITTSSARVDWTTDELADSLVQYGLTASYGSSVFEAPTVANHQVPLTGLAAGTLYHFRVSSHDASGNGATSTDQTFTTLPDTTPPANVSGFAAAPGDRQNSLTWTNPPDADFAGVKIQRSATGFPSSPTSGTTVYDGNGTAFLDTGLTNGTTYFYAAFAYDGSGNFASGALASGTPTDGLPPGPVSNLSITPGDQQNALTWTNPSDPDFLQVRIQRSTTGFPATPTSGTTVYEAAAPSFTDTGLVNGTSYFYSVFAQDTSLNYSTAAQVSGTPAAPLPVCGDSVCAPTENNASCPADCPVVPVCGNAVCEPTESNVNCPADCQLIAICGDSTCQPPENSGSCPTDCPVIAVCGNSVCEPSENNLSCPADCPAVVICGDATCQAPETPVSCPADCVAPIPEGPVCGNGPCEPGETNLMCPADCPLEPTEPEPIIEIPEETIDPEDAMDVTRVKYYTHGRTLEITPNDLGFISILSDVIFSVMIKVDAFKKPVEKLYLVFGDSMYQFGLTDDKTAYVVDIVVPSARSGAGRTGDADLMRLVRALAGIETANAAETLYTVKTALIIYYQDGSIEVATPTINVQDDGRVIERVAGEDQGVAGAKVTLSRMIGGEWVVWNASFYMQTNPVTTRADGSYGFMVPSGEYRFEAEKEGYRKATTASITPTKDAPNININIEMIRIPEPWTDVIVPGATVIENIGNVALATGRQTAYIAKVVQKEIIEDPRVKTATTNFIVPASALVTTTILITAVQAGALVNYLYFLITQPLLLLGRRKRKEYGVVYNSLTKLPVDLAIVRLYRVSNNRLVRTIVTDKQGRYAFLLEPGEYRLEATKQNYVFPSEYMKERREDLQYLDLYHGETVRVGAQGAIITANIPMDPVELVKSNRRLVLEEVARKVQNFLAPFSVYLTLAAFVLYREAYLAVLLAVQIALYFLFRRLARPKQPKNWGIIYDEGSKKPIPFAIARIVETQYNKILESRITDSRGRYNFLVGNNKYFVTVEKPGYDSSKTADIDLTTKERGGGVISVDIPMRPKKKP